MDSVFIELIIIVDHQAIDERSAHDAPRSPLRASSSHCPRTPCARRYAPAFGERPLAAPELGHIRRALE
jgi:hypothetical protein